MLFYFEKVDLRINGPFHNCEVWVMSLITWNDNFSVSIPQFDQEHQQLIAMINSLHEAMKQGTGKKAMGTLLDDLTNYASTHFSHEEQMMVQYSYPDFKKHKQSHVDFAQTIKEYRTLYENSSLSAGNLLNLLQSWLINHICDTDKQYTAFFKRIHWDGALFILVLEYGSFS